MIKKIIASLALVSAMLFGMTTAVPFAEGAYVGLTASAASVENGSEASNPTQGAAKNSMVTLGGKPVDNHNKNGYYVWPNWSQPVTSYLAQEPDGMLTLVAYTGTDVLVEEYFGDETPVNSLSIKPELPLFGGFFSGETYNFIVFGQENLSQSQQTEVLRVVRYDKNWNRLGAASVFGANTLIPFDAGSLRMDEANGRLYIHTCHEMFTSRDGLNHQANMSYVVEETTDTVVDSWYRVMNISVGYVSHSFNQFIKTDDEYVFRADHGDAYPRGVVLMRSRLDGELTSVTSVSALDVPGSIGANSTGVSVGGLELSADSCLIAGDSVDVSDPQKYDSTGVRNIFLSIVPKDFRGGSLLWLTDYDESSSIEVSMPQLVKVTDDRFIVMWEEKEKSDDTWWNDDSDDSVELQIRAIDSSGRVLDSAKSNVLRLSDCQPIVDAEGSVVWYVSDGYETTLYRIDPYDLGNVKNIKPDPKSIIGRLTSGKTVRFAGEGRQHTAALISAEAFSSTENVFIASGDSSPDALAGVPLAYAMNAPILLVRKNDGLDPATQAELQRLKAKNVYILGGTGAVSSGIEKEIQRLGCKTDRIAGADRFGTAVQIAEKLKKVVGSPKEAFFVYSHNYPDALAVSGIAAVKHAPILYVSGSGDLKASAEFMRKNGSIKQTYIIGGYAAIKKTADKSLSKYASVARIYGSDRYITCAAINESFADTMTGSSVCVATGTNFPDALAGGVLAAKTKSPMVLVNDSLYGYQEEFISERAPSTIYIFGGTAAVSKNIERELMLE